jgi:hypothetical protein
MYSYNWNGTTYRHDEIWNAANRYSLCDPFWRNLYWILETQNPAEMADEIASAFKTVYGDVIVSWAEDEIVETILDDWREDTGGVRYGDDHVFVWFLHRAFRKAGFKYGRECDAQTIERIRLRQDWSTRFRTWTSSYVVRGGGSDLVLEYAFDYSKLFAIQIQSELLAELTQYLHHPRFMAKWVGAGNDPENYLPHLA